jgi:hypothetical protein
MRPEAYRGARLEQIRHIINNCLLWTGVAPQVLTFHSSSSGESQEYLNSVLELSDFNIDPYFTILVLFLIVNTPL